MQLQLHNYMCKILIVVSVVNNNSNGKHRTKMEIGVAVDSSL